MSSRNHPIDGDHSYCKLSSSYPNLEPQPNTGYECKHLIGLALKRSVTGELTISSIAAFLHQHFPHHPISENRLRKTLLEDEWFMNIDERWTMAPDMVAVMETELHWRAKEYPYTISRTMRDPDQLGTLLNGDRPVASNTKPVSGNRKRGLLPVHLVALAMKNNQWKPLTENLIIQFLATHFPSSPLRFPSSVHYTLKNNGGSFHQTKSRPPLWTIDPNEIPTIEKEIKERSLEFSTIISSWMRKPQDLFMLNTKMSPEQQTAEKEVAGFSCEQLILLALKHSPSGSLSVASICEFIDENFLHCDTRAIKFTLQSKRELFLEIDNPNSSGDTEWAVFPNAIAQMEKELLWHANEHPYSVCRTMKNPEDLRDLMQGKLNKRRIITAETFKNPFTHITPQTYINVIAMAIKSQATRSMQFSDISDFVLKHFPKIKKDGQELGPILMKTLNESTLFRTNGQLWKMKRTGSSLYSLFVTSALSQISEMSLSAIFVFICKKWPYFETADEGWRRAINEALIVEQHFVFRIIVGGLVRWSTHKKYRWSNQSFHMVALALLHGPKKWTSINKFICEHFPSVGITRERIISPLLNEHCFQMVPNGSEKVVWDSPWMIVTAKRAEVQNQVRTFFSSRPAVSIIQRMPRPQDLHALIIPNGLVMKREAITLPPLQIAPTPAPPSDTDYHPETPAVNNGFSVVNLIALALKNSPSGSLSQQDICNFIKKYFPAIFVGGNIAQVVRDSLYNGYFMRLEDGGKWMLAPDQIKDMEEDLKLRARKYSKIILEKMEYPQLLPILLRRNGAVARRNEYNAADLIRIALRSCGTENRLHLSNDILNFIGEHFPDYVEMQPGWRSKIRDALKKVGLKSSSVLNSHHTQEVSRIIKEPEETFVYPMETEADEYYTISTIGQAVLVEAPEEMDIKTEIKEEPAEDEEFMVLDSNYLANVDPLEQLDPFEGC